MSEQRELTGLDLANAEVKRLASDHTARLARLEGEIEAARVAYRDAIESGKVDTSLEAAVLGTLRRAHAIITGAKP